MRMMTLNRGLAVVRESIPSDLREWMDGHALVCEILEARHNLEEANRRGETSGQSARRSQLEVMLTLLTYCYATGILATDEIVRRAENDTMLRYLCGRNQPEAGILRQCRRYHRAEIEGILTDVLGRVWEHRTELLAREFHTAEPARPDFQRMARERILDAIQLDSMALDD